MLPQYHPSRSAWAQRVKFRAKNGFGGTNLEEKVFVIRNGQVTEMMDYEDTP